MKLKLAEYKDGKFERFLELGQHFFFGGEFIILKNIFKDSDLLARDVFKKDEKDPLNRFDGLFDGRTYGGGRFVLIEKSSAISQDDIIVFGGWTKLIKKSEQFIRSGSANDYYTIWTSGLSMATDYEESNSYKIIGNLHENPELWEKVK